MSKVLFNIAFTQNTPPAYLKAAGRAAYIARRKFYNLTADYNILSYLLDGKKVVKNRDAADYFTRSGSNSGLFNEKGALSADKFSKIKEDLKNTKSNIWHGFISFDDISSKGFQSQEKAIAFVNKTMGAFFERTHLKRKNIELLCALHEDTEHRHIHFCFYEKAPHLNKHGKLSYTQKGNINKKAIDNCLVSMNMHLSDNSYDYYTARDRAIGKLKELLGDNSVLSDTSLMTKLTGFSSKLPKTGRLQYNSPNMICYRSEIDEIVLLLIKASPEAKEHHEKLLATLAKKEIEVKELALENRLTEINGRLLTKDEIKRIILKGKTKFIQENGIDLKHIDYIDKLRLEYKSRLGNQVLGLIMEMNRDMREKRRAAVNDKHEKIQARSGRRIKTKALQNFMKALGSYQAGVRADFTHTLQQIERQIEMERESV